MSEYAYHTATVLIQRPRGGQWKTELAMVQFRRSGSIWYAGCYALELTVVGEADEPMESVGRRIGLELLPFVVEQ